MLARDVVFAKVRNALRAVVGDDCVDIRLEDHLVDDLGFDSPKVASLTIALEDEFDEVLLLNDWIAAADGPSQLTVASLVDHLTALLADDA